MTLEQADSARRRAAQMLANFGDEDGAAEFDSMTAEEYAEHKGIEVTNGTPEKREGTARVHLQPIGRRRHMAKQSARTTELEDTIRDIYDVVQEAGPTRAEQLDALNNVADLCTAALPDLDEDEEEEESGDDNDDNTEEEEEE